MLTPDEVEMYRNKAVLFAKTGSLHTSADMLQYCIESGSTNIDVLLDAARVHSAISEFNKSKLYYHEAFSILLQHNVVNLGVLNEMQAVYRVEDKLHVFLNFLDNHKMRSAEIYSLFCEISLEIAGKYVVSVNNMLSIMLRNSFSMYALAQSDRIGQLVDTCERFLRDKQIDAKKILLISENAPSNTQIVKMYSRHLNIVTDQLLFDAMLKYKNELTGCDNYFETYLEDTAYYYDLFQKTTVTLRFTDDEEEYGRSELNKIGLPENAWFVLLFARDGEYLKVHTGHEWAYHDYRDMNINDYEKAINYIISLGGYVVTFGKYTRQKLNMRHEKVIHYAGSQHRSDFMDVYLSSHCKFIIGNPSGAVQIATVTFEKPWLAPNYCPVGYKPYMKNSLYIPKKVLELSTGNILKYGELFRRFIKPEVAIGHGPMFQELGYAYIDNTQDEILDAVVEMFGLLEKSFLRNPEEQLIIDNYIGLYPAGHFAEKIKTPVAISFIMSNKELYF